MNELSIFVDESGDFGTYEPHAPFYLFTLVFHNQHSSINEQIEHLEHGLSDMGFDVKHCFHAVPIIRREEDYQYLSISERRKCLNRILAFSKSTDIMRSLTRSRKTARATRQRHLQVFLRDVSVNNQA